VKDAAKEEDIMELHFRLGATIVSSCTFFISIYGYTFIFACSGMQSIKLWSGWCVIIYLTIISKFSMETDLTVFSSLLAKLVDVI